MQKIKWIAPRLIVLVKSKLEEGVLGACKKSPGGGPGGAAGQCVAPGWGSCLFTCSSYTAS